MLKTESAGGIVLNQRGQVLVVSQHGTSWSLPKGHIHEGEDPFTAAKREIREESGIEELIWIKGLGSYERHKIGQDGQDDLGEYKKIYMYLFRTPQMELKPVDPHNPEARWVEIDEVADLLTHQKDREFFLYVKRAIPSLKNF